MRQHFEELSKEWKAFFNKEENNVDQIYKDLTIELTETVINKNHLDLENILTNIEYFKLNKNSLLFLSKQIK